MLAEDVQFVPSEDNEEVRVSEDTFAVFSYSQVFFFVRRLTTWNNPPNDWFRHNLMVTTRF